MSRPLLVTDDPLVLEDLLRLAERAGAEVDVAPSSDVAGARWAAAPVIIVGPDAVGAGVRDRRPGVVVVGTDLDDIDVWDRAAGLGAEHVVFLPDAEPWLVDLLADATRPAGPGRVVGVVGGRGGAGATSLAVALAVRAADTGWRTVLVDADPLGGGIDLALGVEDVPGPRWSALADDAGPNGVAGLPRAGEVTVLAVDRGDFPLPAAATVQGLLETVTAGADLVVIDLPRSLSGAGAVAAGRCDTVLLIVPAEVRACAAAARVAAALTGRCRDVRVVVRGPAPGGLDATLVAGSLGLPLAGAMRPEPDLDRDLEQGLPPGRRSRGPLSRLATALLLDLGLPAGPVPAGSSAA